LLNSAMLVWAHLHAKAYLPTFWKLAPLIVSLSLSVGPPAQPYCRSGVKVSEFTGPLCATFVQECLLFGGGGCSCVLQAQIIQATGAKRASSAKIRTIKTVNMSTV
jgi:hypothetical protein